MFKRLILTLALLSTLFAALPAHAEDSIPPVQRLGTGIPTSIAASPDGKTLAVGSSIGVWLLDATTLKPFGFWDTGFWVEKVDYSSAGNYLKVLVRRYDENSGLVEVSEISPLWLYDADQVVLWNKSNSARSRLNKQELIYQTIDGKTASLNQTSNQLQWIEHGCTLDQSLCAITKTDNHQVVVSNTGLVSAFFADLNAKDSALSSDGKILYGVTTGGVKSWRVNKSKAIATLTNFFTGATANISWSADGKHIASGLAIWAIDSGQISGSRPCVWMTTFLCNSSLIRAFNSVYRYESITQRQLQRFAPHRVYLSAAKLNQSNTLLATSGDNEVCGYDNRIGCGNTKEATRIWDFQSFNLKASLPVRFLDIAFTNNDQILVGKTLKGLEVWNWQTAERIGSIEVDGGCQYWHMLNWMRWHDYERDRARTQCIAVDSTSKYVATFPNFSNSAVVHLWRLDTGELAATFTGHTSEITALAFSPDGSKLAASSLDGTILIWNVP